MKALELDSTNALVQHSLADMRYCDLWDWKGSESAYKVSISLNPNDGLTHASYSNLLDILGRPTISRDCKEDEPSLQINLKFIQFLDD
jgi:Tfp pilus assembly protein PilF